MAQVKDAYGKERVPGSSGSNTTSGSTPAPTGSSVNEQQRAEQTAMRNMQKSSGSASGSSSQAPSANSYVSNSQASSGNPVYGGQSSAPATGSAWKSPSTGGSINQEQRAEQFSARRMGTTLQTRQGGSGSYLGSQLQQQKPATDTAPGWRAKSADETNATAPKQPQFQPYLSDRIKTRQEMEGKGPDMMQDRLSDEQKALMELVARLPEDFPVNTWDAMSTNKQREIIGKTDLSDQEQWAILNAGPSIKTLSMLLDLSQNQQEYGLTNAELLAVTDQLLELGNVRTGVQNHDIFPGHNGMQKAGHTFIANKEDAIMEDIKLSASDRLAENGQVEEDPDTRYNTGGSNAGELAQQRVNSVMAEFNDATGPYDRNTMTTEQLEILEEAEKTLQDKAYAGTLTEEEKNSILDRACEVIAQNRVAEEANKFWENLLVFTPLGLMGCAPNEVYDLSEVGRLSLSSNSFTITQKLKPNSDNSISIDLTGQSKGTRIKSANVYIMSDIKANGITKTIYPESGSGSLELDAEGITFSNLVSGKEYTITITVKFEDKSEDYIDKTDWYKRNRMEEINAEFY